MLTPFDEYPIHQTALPVVQVADGHPDAYDRFWFNGYRDDLYFGIAMARYPNRGILDAAFSVLHDGVQRSVFASGRAPLDPTVTTIGPISIDITDPLRVNTVIVDAPEQDLRAELTYTARTAAIEEPRQTRYDGPKLMMDATRLTQMGTWTGTITTGGTTIDLDAVTTRGTKDRSWGIRPVGQPAPAAPAQQLPQIFFLWAPLQFDDECLHLLVFEESDGTRWSETARRVPLLAPGDPLFGPGTGGTALGAVEHAVRWEKGLRRSRGATWTLADGSTLELEPLLTFRMRGIGYLHPVWGHGLWHGELEVGGEAPKAAELDTLDPSCVHVQQVMRVTWGDKVGLGVMEQLAIGPHHPSGLPGLLDGYPG